MTAADQALRVNVGQGTVTVLNSIPNAFMQTTILDCDHAPMLAAALQAEAGATVWFYLSEKRWPWSRGCGRKAGSPWCWAA